MLRMMDWRRQLLHQLQRMQIAVALLLFRGLAWGCMSQLSSVGKL